ncbi:MAG: PAC2 family protein [Deltaproteobacteria bacterium]
MKNNIRFTRKVRLKNPVMIAAWPGMGDVAIKAVVYLKDQLKAQPFATFAAADFYHPSGVLVEAGQVVLPPAPEGHFYAVRGAASGRDVVLFVSNAQPLIDQSFTYAEELVDFAAGLGVKTLYTFAAMPLPIEHTERPQVRAVATDKKLLEGLAVRHIKVMPSGQISGLNGLILGAAKERRMDGICLLGEIPLYTVQIENPLASMAVLEKLGGLLGMKLDLAGLAKHAARMNQEIEHLVDYLKNPSPAETPIDEEEIEDIKKRLADASGLPESARRHIDKLFFLARRDLSRATELKQELDKWSVYDTYEDRFLDLFKKTPKKNN